MQKLKTGVTSAATRFFGDKGGANDNLMLLYRDDTEDSHMANAIFNEFFGEGSAQGVHALRDLFAESHKELYPDDADSNHTFTANFAMLLKQASMEGRHNSVLYKPSSAKVFYDKDTFVKGSRMALFASGIYAGSDEGVVAQVPGITKEDIKFSYRSDAVRTPNCSVILDPVSDRIVLAIRGTANFTDALTDIEAHGEDYMNGRAHGGMLENAGKVLEQALPALEELVRDTGKDVAIVGHSLGAGTAVCLVLRLFNDHKGLLCGRKVTDSVHCWAFAAPPVFGPLHKLPRGAAGVVTNFVHHVDMIPRLTLAACMQLFKAVKTVDEADIPAIKRYEYLSGLESDVGTPLPDYEPFHANAFSHFERYEHFGQLLLVTHPAEEAGGKPRDPDGEATQYSCHHIQPDLLDRLLVHREMIGAHLMVGYMGALDGLAKQEDPRTWKGKLADAMFGK